MRNLIALVLPLLLGVTAAPAADSAYRLYVTNEKSGDVTVIDGAARTVLATFAVGKRPRGIQIAPDGKTLYVALSGSPMLGPPVGAGGKPVKPRDDDDGGPPADKAADGIGVIDAARLTFLRKFAVGSDPEQFAISFDGTRLFIANEDVATASIYSLASQKVEQIVPVGKEPEGVSVTPDGRQVYVTCEATGEIVVIDLATAAVAGRIATGGRPRSVVFTPDSATGFAASETNATVYVIDVAKRVVSSALKLAGGEAVRPMGTAIAQDGRKAYVSTGRGGTVVVIDTATAAVVKTIPVGKRPWGLALSPDGKFLFSANGPSNDVSVVDLASEQEVGRIAVGDSPWGIAVGPALAK